MYRSHRERARGVWARAIGAHVYARGIGERIRPLQVAFRYLDMFFFLSWTEVAECGSAIQDAFVGTPSSAALAFIVGFVFYILENGQGP